MNVVINNHRLVALWRLFFCVLPIFAGCAALEKREAVVTTLITRPTEDAASTETTNFSLIGRVLVKTDRQGFSGGVHWQHSDISDEILLFSPLGQTVAQINRDLEGVRLITSEQKAYHAASVEDLTEEVLGWRLPLAGLQFWILGTHSPLTFSEIDLDKNGRTVAIRQDGWQIVFLDYFSQQTTKDRYFPRVMELSRIDLKFRLVIDNWKVED